MVRTKDITFLQLVKPFQCKLSPMLEMHEKSSLFKLYLLEREEVLRHKWVLSERAGHDVGYDVAVLSWVRNHRKLWWDEQVKKLGRKPPV